MADGKPIPLGKPLQLDDDQLEQAAQVQDLDIAAAVQLWRNLAPKKFKTLLDAQPVSDDEVQDDEE